MEVRWYVLGLTIQLLLCSCANKSEEDLFFIVREYNEAYFQDSLNPVHDYYTKHNIILLGQSDSIFYHDFYMGCGTGWSPYDPPREINFEIWPMRIFRNVDQVADMIRHVENTPRLVMLISDRDTIRDNRYFELKKNLEQIEKTYIISTRLITNYEQAEINRIMVQK